MRKDQRNTRLHSITALILTVILSASLLCACGADQEAGTETETSGEAAAETETETEEETETETEEETETETEEETTDPASLIDYSAKYPYIIYVNRSLNRIVIYGIDYNGEYTVPYTGFVCSVGLATDSDNETPDGTFRISDKYEWRELNGGYYAQYAVRICGSILFHSVPYVTTSKDTLLTAEYNKLGEAASQGCIRLAVIDAKWIYDNCPSGTQVVIYDDEDEVFEVEFRKTITISEDSAYAGWDPTDPDEENPWNH